MPWKHSSVGSCPIAFLFLADIRVAITRYDNTVLVFFFLNVGLFCDYD